ncbi:MAG: BlaI/MecI/CopY family transcriptional regulator [Oscillospiraceae bacterium]|nr:BlaI/MecI/CopY family transcriptional regulator [Oscillospiraceae bacterium]MBQ3048823.1 BlaI/MecI/CopY family transcriptional regulator [Oscillospiraceae bacterium]MBQ9938696.1 BlaI/MecI/CopY family transcriptional regulator [Oscillospiraceae bacterium]
MQTPKIFESEYRFCLILWEHEPIKSTELAKLCKEKLDWSKTTTYTVIKRLGERGVLKNENTIVTSLISKDEAQQSELDELMEKKFEGSLPAFIAAFARRQELTDDEVEEIRRIIER